MGSCICGSAVQGWLGDRISIHAIHKYMSRENEKKTEYTSLGMLTFKGKSDEIETEKKHSEES